MTNAEATTARNIKYDLCEACRMPRQDRHHSANYKMDHSAYDIPRHEFVAPYAGDPTCSHAVTNCPHFS